MYMFIIYIYIAIASPDLLVAWRNHHHSMITMHHIIISFFFLTQRVFPTSSWCLLRRWTGDPPETFEWSDL